MSEQRAALKYSTQAGRDAPALFGAGLFGRGSCRVCVSKPTASKPSQRTRGHQEDAEPAEGLSNTAQRMETPPQHGLQGHPATTSQVRGSGFAQGEPVKVHPESPPLKSWGLEENGEDKAQGRGFNLPAAQGSPSHLCLPGN